MPHPLLDRDEIHETPVAYLSRVGTIFAEFGPPTQDSGNVSYGVRIGEERYFVKTAGSPAGSRSLLKHPARVALLRNAARLAATCPHSALPRLHRTVESPHGPMLVYEWLDGELLHCPGDQRSSPASPFERFRQLPPATILACLDTVYALHADLARAGWVACDFYDGCLIYDFASGRLGVVDLDTYHRGPFRNEMGRMFGSTRFMAPEEFELGAMVDERTTVFTLGRTALVLLSDGTLRPEAFRGPRVLFDVVTQACRPGPSDRFASVAAFHSAWLAARGT